MRPRFLLALVLLAALARPAAAEEPVTGQATMRDAVTVAIGGARFRLEGIEPPADTAVCGPKPCTVAAAEELARLLAGRQVTCSKVRRLGHGYFLSSCRLEDGMDASAYLLSAGLAGLGGDASESQRVAAEQGRAARKGIWALH